MSRLSIVPPKPESMAAKIERLARVVLDEALAADVPLATRLDALKVVRHMKTEDDEDPERVPLMERMRREINSASSGDE